MPNIKHWTTKSLYEALRELVLFNGEKAKAELVEGIESAIHITMHNYGDLPIFLTVCGEQIVVESLLWPASDVVDISGFNDSVLRTQKYFPLSSISLDRLGSSDYYHMFGALSSTSILKNVVFEIETLAKNVIQATEAFEEFLNVVDQAS